MQTLSIKKTNDAKLSKFEEFVDMNCTESHYPLIRYRNQGLRRRIDICLSKRPILRMTITINADIPALARSIP